MTDEEAIARLGATCPCHVLGVLHARGDYLHYADPSSPGRVYCYHHSSPVPDNLVMTDASRHFMKEEML